MLQIAQGHVGLFPAIVRNDATVGARPIVDDLVNRFQVSRVTGTNHAYLLVWHLVYAGEDHTSLMVTIDHDIAKVRRDIALTSFQTVNRKGPSENTPRDSRC